MSEPIHSFTQDILVNVSMTGSITSDPCDVTETITNCVQIVWDSDNFPIGNVFLSASNTLNGTYTEIEETILGIDTNSGDHMINLERSGYCFIKVNYTRTSGSGNMNANVTGKRN